MATKKPEGTFELTGIEMLPGKATLSAASSTGTFKHCYTSGPFLLPQGSGSLDWTILNNASGPQSVRVTVFKCPVGTVKSAMPPGPLVVTIDPGESTHNANEYPEGFAYEVQVECNSRRVFPYVSVWPANFGVVIPGTGIPAGSFRRRLA